MNSFLELQFTDKIIHSYRDDSDLQNFIDFAQQEFKCCGLSNAGYQDWSEYHISIAYRHVYANISIENIRIGSLIFGVVLGLIKIFS